MRKKAAQLQPQVSGITIATCVERAVNACDEVIGKYVELHKKLNCADKSGAGKLSPQIEQALGALYNETKVLNEELQALREFKLAMTESLEEPLPVELSNDIDDAPFDPHITDEGFLRTIISIVRDKNPISRMFCYAALLARFNDEIIARKDRVDKLKTRSRQDPSSEEAKTAKLLRSKNEEAVVILEKRRIRIGQQFLKLRLYVLKRVLNASTKVSDMFPNGGMRAFEVCEQLRNSRDNTMLFDSKTGEPVMSVKPELTDISTSLRLLWEEIVAQKMSRRQTENWMLNADASRRHK